MRVFVEQLDCTGSGLCEDALPEVFALGDDALATVRDDAGELVPGGAGPNGIEIAEEYVARAADVAAMCPGACIRCL